MGIIKKISIFIFSSITLYGENLILNWDLIPGVQFYEYEIHKSPESKNDSLLVSGRVDKPVLNKESSPGVYFVRIRGIDSNGKSGDWSPMLKTIVRGKSPEVSSPVQNAEHDTGIPLNVEWQEVEGANEYRVLLVSEIKQKIDRLVTTPSTTIKSLPPGDWKLQIYARQGGQLLAKSTLVSFKIRNLDIENSKPVILEPQNGQRIPENKVFNIVWHRRLPGKKTQVTVMRLNGKIVKQVVVGDKNELKLEEVFPKGTYQIIVKNYLEQNDKFVQDLVTVGIGEDPATIREREFSFRSFGGLMFGKYEQSNFFFPGGYSSASSFLTSGGQLILGLSGREAFEVRGMGDIINYEAANLSSDKSQPQFTVGLGINHKSSVFQNFNWKFLASLSRNNHLILRSTPTAQTTILSAAYTIGFLPGFEKTFGDPKARNDFPLEVLFNIPLINTGNDIAGGKPSPILLPSLVHMQILWRFKITKNLKTLFGPQVRYQQITIKEDGQSTKTKVKNLSYGGVVGFEYGIN